MIRLAALLFTAAALATAQPAFEAASIKPALPFAKRTDRWFGIKGGPGSSDPGRIEGRNTSLTGYLTLAYGLRDDQIVAPNSVEGQDWDINAVLPPDTTEADYLLMLQKLLTDRFHLALHRETRQMSVLSLVIAKSGAKLQRPAQASVDAADAGPAPGAPHRIERDADGYPILPKGAEMVMMPGLDRKPRARAQGRKAPLDQLVRMLSGQTAAHVVDATGLSGEFDYTLSWIPSRPGTRPSDEAADAGPDLYQALEQQLGLKLEPAKAPVECLIVDSASSNPVEN